MSHSKFMMLIMDEIRSNEKLRDKMITDCYFSKCIKTLEYADDLEAIAKAVVHELDILTDSIETATKQLKRISERVSTGVIINE